jgi:hypothetical protein
MPSLAEIRMRAARAWICCEKIFGDDQKEGVSGVDKPRRIDPIRRAGNPATVRHIHCIRRYFAMSAPIGSQITFDPFTSGPGIAVLDRLAELLDDSGALEQFESAPPFVAWEEDEEEEEDDLIDDDDDLDLGDEDEDFLDDEDDDDELEEEEDLLEDE